MSTEPTTQRRRARAGTVSTEDDPNHHLTNGFRPQTPVDNHVSSPLRPSKSPRERSPVVDAFSTESRGLWDDLRTLRWAIVPSSSLKMLLIPVALWASCELLRALLGQNWPNPFAPLLFISHRVPTSTPEDPRYQKGYLDLVFIAYYIIVWSFVRQSITLYICLPMARALGLRKKSKVTRFGEQAYAVVYFGFNAIWGLRIMTQLPTWWFDTKYFWIDYPHWQMIPVLKAYYLTQAAYWCQQLLVLLLGLEKPRKDYMEYAAHHFVTLWLVGWSYLINLTLIGNAIFVSMDIPDTFFAFSKILNYMGWDRAKIFSFVWLMIVWTYFRHYTNIRILWSVLTEFHLMPDYAKEWSPKDGWWMVWWMQYQVFVPIFLLQLIQIFWYTLIWRIAIRAISDITVDDIRSDDEDEDEPELDHKDD